MWGYPARIIPARAGFTTMRAIAPFWTTDHPRSRGVYTPSSCLADSMAGSSPLARGLQGDWRGRLADARIIPARAGFT